MNMTKKSFIKSKKYYKEAENMQEGWGETLRQIDILKNKIQFKKEITLDDYCYSLYGDCYCSHCWEAFKLYCEKTLKYSRKKLIHDCWKGLFDFWVKNDYNSSEFYQ